METDDLDGSNGRFEWSEGGFRASDGTDFRRQHHDWRTFDRAFDRDEAIRIPNPVVWMC
ncbi:MAG: hypothetical protein SWY16_21620 [Cyanobacteriota bacterium]|nr:hypothetical protein [Cyanobacteriota bacterium]